MREPDRFHRPDPATMKQEEAAIQFTPPRADAEHAAGIDAVRRRHEKELLAIDGVTGVAIGRTATGQDAIVVYLREASAEACVPVAIEGYSVQTVVTGIIEAS
jgi:hypothetical protein